MRCLPFLLAAAVGCSAGSPSNPSDPVVLPAAPAPEAGTPEVPPAEAPAPELAAAERLFSWLEGTFDSKDQAKTDKAYFEITLTTCRVVLPALGAEVLYVEQARAGAAPYRQRLYLVEAIDATTARSRVFEPGDTAALVGLCTASKRPELAARDFVERVGCAVEMHWTGDRFEGHTPNARWNGTAFVDDPAGAKCPSQLNGASFASSEVILERERMTSWDRGFDAKGVQVWGATKGGYVFIRRSPAPER